MLDSAIFGKVFVQRSAFSWRFRLLWGVHSTNIRPTYYFERAKQWMARAWLMGTETGLGLGLEWRMGHEWLSRGYRRCGMRYWQRLSFLQDTSHLRYLSDQSR